MMKELLGYALSDVLSGNFRPSAGMRQGYIISLLLFNSYTDLIMRITLEDWAAAVGIWRIANWRYADNTTLFATNAQHLLELLMRMK